MAGWRRYYRLTEPGGAALAAETARTAGARGARAASAACGTAPPRSGPAHRRRACLMPMTARAAERLPGGSLDERFVRSARFWLRAYPRRWRAVRAPEMTEVLADLTGSGARRLDVRGAPMWCAAAWATGGASTDASAHVRVSDVGRRLPARYDAWVWDDLTGALYGVRQTFPGCHGRCLLRSHLRTRGGRQQSSLRGSRCCSCSDRVVAPRGSAPFFPPRRRRGDRPGGLPLCPAPPVRRAPDARATALIGLVAAGTLLGACTFATAGTTSPVSRRLVRTSPW